MTFHIITIFPEIFESYFSESIIGRAKKEGLIDIKIYNLRDYTHDKHKTVDDTPYGGGAGMVMKVEPIFEAVSGIKEKIGKDKKARVVLFAAKGQKYTQSDSKRLLDYDDIIFICGRYEGIDERVRENLADEEISIGDYVLTGGEIPAMVLVDSISRHIPGVLGNPESLDEESHGEIDLEYPQYTKPEQFNEWKVPEVLLSGDHKKIKEWREKHSE
ncbi:MAG: tRNA (guanosine(37)-N1)-methyltransferase TrmD [Candidatus Moranbacteria bacterium]|nr:tRNA (guanosine(37)-N1)-methyltransferase TrmD [Candidatus Moranbacteria bacterium]